jgi:hypothetical protein
MPDSRLHIEDERGVTLSAMPRSGFIMVDPELILGGVEALLDGPTMIFGIDRMTAVP